MLHLYWMIGEVIFIIFFFSFILFQLWRRAKTQTGKIEIPNSLNGKIIHYIKRLLRLLGFGLGILFLIILLVSIDRAVFSVITETAPAPSKVTIPSDLGFEITEVTFESEDGIQLAGWYTPSQNGTTIILLHGYGGNRTGMIWHAQQLTNADYGVLMYDERASGESTGEYRSYGWEDHRDVKATAEFIHSQNPNEHIGAVGCSTGASIVVYSAALYPEIEAAWGDGNSSVRAQDLPTPTNPLMAIIIGNNYLIDWLYTVKLGIEEPVPLTDILPNIAPRPIMFVGGGREQPLLGSEGELYTLRYAELAGVNAQAWVIDEATHCDGPFLRPDEYSQKMVKFFDEAFSIER